MQLVISSQRDEEDSILNLWQTRRRKVSVTMALTLLYFEIETILMYTQFIKI